jgi:serine/threonine protein kinase/tetratricopeptide (TPR) repeat protein
MDALPPSLTTALSGRYEFQGVIGTGGMARVYLAADLRHGRKVAIKVVREDIATAMGSERFLNEIRTTAALQHPHILPLLDSGDASGHLYYVMPFVAGESLRTRMDRAGAMEVAEAVPIARQIAGALDHAHRNGVVHRDIKPENVLLADGLPVVADFGIALAISQAAGDRLTQTGSSLGTPAYMSPEQVTGARDVDGRSDQYSLACMLYEMLCGRPAFRGATAQATMVEHVVATIPPLRGTVGPVGDRVEAAIRRALAKDPGERFATMGDFAAALTIGVTATQSAPHGNSASIVVLPFENLSTDQENAFFADGLTEEIITDLSKVGALRVISRASAMALKGVKRSVPSICAELNVRYALEGGVRRAGNNLRITAQLNDSSSDAQIWAEKYSGTMDDVFELQERLSREIVDALRVRLTPDEQRRIAARDVTDVRVFECCAMARSELWRMSADGLTRARTMVEEGLQRFGRKPALVSMLAAIEWNLMNWGIDRDEEHVRRAESLAREVLEADAENAQALFVLAFIRASRGNMPEAIDYALRAHEREPANPDVLLVLTAAYSAIGRASETLRYGRQTAEVDPLTPISHWVAGWAYLMTGDPARAKVRFQDGGRLAPGEAVFGIFSGIAHWYLRDMEQARAGFEKGVETEGFLGMLSRGYLRAINRAGGDVMPELDEETAQWIATDWQYSLHTAQVYSLAGDHDAAMRWLNHAVQRGLVNYPFLSEFDQFLVPLRQREDFTDLLERVRVEWMRAANV